MASGCGVVAETTIDHGLREIVLLTLNPVVKTFVKYYKTPVIIKQRFPFKSIIFRLKISATSPREMICHCHTCKTQMRLI